MLATYCMPCCFMVVCAFACFVQLHGVRFLSKHACVCVAARALPSQTVAAALSECMSASSGHKRLAQDLDAVYEANETARQAVRAVLNAGALRAALRRLLPLPARSRYVCVTLLPQAPLSARVVRHSAAT